MLCTYRACQSKFASFTFFLHPMDDSGLPLNLCPDEMCLLFHCPGVWLHTGLDLLLSTVHEECSIQNMKVIVLQTHVISLDDDQSELNVAVKLLGRFCVLYCIMFRVRISVCMHIRCYIEKPTDSGVSISREYRVKRTTSDGALFARYLRTGTN